MTRLLITAALIIWFFPAVVQAWRTAMMGDFDLLLGLCIFGVPILTVWIALKLFRLMVQGGDPGPAGATTNTGFENW
jgi:hypothetical protein